MFCNNENLYEIVIIVKRTVRIKVTYNLILSFLQIIFLCNMEKKSKNIPKKNAFINVFLKVENDFLSNIRGPKKIVKL